MMDHVLSTLQESVGNIVDAIYAQTRKYDIFEGERVAALLVKVVVSKILTKFFF